MIVLLSDPRNEFKLQVKKEVFDIYQNKLKELQILAGRRAEAKTEDKDVYASVPVFSTIVERAKAKFGEDSKFYLFLKLYNIMPGRDNF
jgi:hypothetical protein